MKHDYAFVQHQPRVSPANEPSPKRCNISQKKKRILTGCVLFFAVLDGIFKILAIHHHLPFLNTAFLNISYFANPGIAFSIPLPQQLTLIITGLLIGTFVFLTKTAKEPAIQIGMLSVLLGSSSNFIDRILTGYTTDYLIFFSRSAINIADILIIVGMGTCAWYYQKADRKKEGE